jgi:hypothetical protein
MLNILRFGAFAVAILIFVTLSLFLFMSFAFPSETVYTPMEKVVFVLGVPSAMTAGYAYVSIFGERMLRSAVLRLGGGILLSVPIAVAVIPLLTEHPEFNFVSVALLSISGLLFSAFVFPAWLKSANRQLQRTPSVPLTKQV